MMIYKKNFKFGKAIALIDELTRSESAVHDPRIMSFLLKLKYEMQILSQSSRGQKMEAEITLLNHLTIID